MKSDDIQAPALSFGIAGSWISDVFEASPLGILHVDLSGKVLYMNATSVSIWGFDKWEDKTLRDLFSDEDTYKQIQAHIAKRRQHMSEEYEVEITRLPDKRRIPIRIAGWPLNLPEQGVVGAISVIRSMETERAIQGINRHIADAKTASDLLVGISEEVRKVLPADLILVSTYSRNMRSARVSFASPDGLLPPSRRWYRLSDRVFEWALKQDRIKVLLQDFYQNFKDPPVLSLINSGLIELMRCAVRGEGRLVGSVSLFTKRKTGFSESEFEIFGRLPMAKAVRAALYLESQKDLEFRLQLLKQISETRGDSELYQCVVDGVAKRYGLSYVSIFIIDYAQRRLVMKSQVGQVERLAPQGFIANIDETLWKKVFGTATAQTPILDETLSVLFRGTRQDIVRSSVSMGIRAHEGMYALLNIEDDRDDAISDDEREVLRSILDELGNVIDRRRRDNLARAAFRSAPISVMVVDGMGFIYQANPAAHRLLGITAGNLVGKSITEFVKDPNKNIVQELINGSRNVELAFPSSDGSNSQPILPVTITSSAIEEADDRRLLTIRDLLLEKKADELQELSELYLSLAREMKTPLSMVGIFLEDLRMTDDSSFQGKVGALLGRRSQRRGVVEELINAARSQLRKVELTYDQLLLRNVRAAKASFVPLYVDLGQLLEDLLNDFPQLELDRIEFRSPNERLFVRGEPAQLAFVIETLLGYVLRYSPPRQKVHVELKPKASTVVLQLAAAQKATSEAEATSKDELQRSKITLDVSLGRQALLDVIRLHKGHFQGPNFEDDRISFTVTLPLDGSK